MHPDPEKFLSGSPYLIDESPEGALRFSSAFEESTRTRDRASVIATRIREEATSALEPYLQVVRTELVAESNVMEGYQWTRSDVTKVVNVHRELIDGPSRTLLQSVRSDPRVYEALGLYKAHEIAENWSRSDRTPREYEIRELHRTILGDVRGSGSYKTRPNAIGGSLHRTTEPFDIGRVMAELADWWSTSEGDPLMTATVVHAWLSHAHPFDDGNGRLARILANLELARRGYPSLVIRPGSDRGEYYDALSASDEGDILPLYRLFGRSLRKQTQLMARPNYVADVLSDRLLASHEERFKLWRESALAFQNNLRKRLEKVGLSMAPQGVPDLTDFSLLWDRRKEGNSWFLKIFDRAGDATWLLWFGYKSDSLMEADEEVHPFPSIFISRRDLDPEAEHPYDPNYPTPEGARRRLLEIAVVPASANPIGLLFERFEFDYHSMERGIGMVAGYLES